jgi:hypothetical protein
MSAFTVDPGVRQAIIERGSSGQFINPIISWIELRGERNHPLGERQHASRALGRKNRVN